MRMKKNGEQAHGGWELSWNQLTYVGSLLLLKINCSTSFPSYPDLTLSLVSQTHVQPSLQKTCPLLLFVLVVFVLLSRCLAQKQQQTQRKGKGPETKWWRSPVWTGMLTLYQSPSVEVHVFDWDVIVFSLPPHLQRPLNTVPPQPPTLESLCSHWSIPLT